MTPEERAHFERYLAQIEAQVTIARRALEAENRNDLRVALVFIGADAHVLVDLVTKP